MLWRFYLSHWHWADLRRRSDPTVYHNIAGKCTAFILNNRLLLGVGGVVYHLRSPSATAGQIVKKRLQRKWSCWKLIDSVIQYMLLLKKYRLDIFWGFFFQFQTFCFLLCLETWNVCGQFPGSWVLSLKLRQSIDKGPSNHKLTSQPKYFLIGFQKRPVLVLLFWSTEHCSNPI